MTYHSIVEQRGAVTFPSFKGERIYMLPFLKAEGLPEEYARWQNTVDAMLNGVDAPGPIYLMVDQGIVKAGNTHRRPGPHIDGYWHPAMQAHGFGGGHGYSPPTGSHNGAPGWGPVPIGDLGRPRKIPVKRKKQPEPVVPLPELNIPHVKRKRRLPKWQGAAFEAPEAIILASDVSACEAFVGPYSGSIEDGGDCAGIDLSNLDRLTMSPYRVYAGNVSFVHQSIPVLHDCKRTVLRLNVPGWTPTIQ